MTTSRHVSVLSDILGLLTRNYANKRRFLKDVLTKANTLIGSDAGFVGLVQSDGQRDVVTVWDRYQQLVGAQHGRWDEDVHDLQIGGADLPKKDRSMTGYVAFTRKPRRSGNVRRETFYRESRRETRSQLTVPIVLGTQTLGVINLESREANFYTAEHETILALVARLIAPTLDGMIARQGLGHGVGDLLQSVGRELESLPPGLPIGAHTFDALARTLAKALSSRTCRIWLIQRPHPLRLLLRGAFGATPRYRFRRELLAHPAGASLRRTVSVKSDTQRTRRPSLAIVPILSGGHAIGFVELSARARRRDNPDSAYTTADLHALQIVGGQIAVTVEANALQAARREQDLKQARQL
jgi:GAF domain-containing protein